jgi:hydrogenase nickel incorporation protein HypA/HybF
MHEVGIMQSMLALATERAEAAGAARIHELRLRIGQLSGVVPESLEFAFELMREGTMAAEARLVVEHVPAACWCAGCQTEFDAPELDYQCPRCHKPSRELRRGTELALASMEIS